MPFFLSAFAFLILPSSSLFIGSFQDNAGHFTFANIQDLAEPSILAAYWLSIRVSAITALGGGILGFLLAYAITIGRTPPWVRSAITTFSGVASNFAGVPLAFAFIATLGRTGFATVLLRDFFQFNIYSKGFSLFTIYGLSLTYLYFQFPLMVLMMTPALAGRNNTMKTARPKIRISSRCAATNAATHC